jgi:hypothetical protein
MAKLLSYGGRSGSHGFPFSTTRVQAVYHCSSAVGPVVPILASFCARFGPRASSEQAQVRVSLGTARSLGTGAKRG